MSATYSPKDYVLPDGLENALEGAMTLQQPLLLTGEPGTGKTTLADWVLWSLQQKGDRPYHDQVLRFQTKTTSTAQDLFYTYDALGHFQAANIKGDVRQVKDFLKLQAYGKALAFSNPQEAYRQLFKTSLPQVPTSSVVLIDEVDKAPRDFTNDILEEINRRYFLLAEQDQTIYQGEEAQIVLIMTSNSEKNLPDAFLRRCAFFHIEFPDEARLRQILQRHLGDHTDYTDQMHQELLAFFKAIRDKKVRKAPATAELIGWMKFLGIKDYFNQPRATQKQMMLHNLSFLVKTQEDLRVARELVETMF